MIDEKDGSIKRKYNNFITDFRMGRLIDIDFEKVESLTIPKGIKSIGENAFDDCKNLDRIIYKDHIYIYKDFKKIIKDINKGYSFR